MTLNNKGDIGNILWNRPSLGINYTYRPSFSKDYFYFFTFYIFVMTRLISCRKLPLPPFYQAFLLYTDAYLLKKYG